ncbi:RTA1 domain-containing protein [Pochonia chlamydosporia 170]|uniref:RTA1 domain-containing protein n=1 Tax=Pochonia chlamydosporia 170 TaxID=1380566 RepID=A0A179G4J9_METCM|nr:RTA1 domain-containing protein [Pochonia chlamydosporia 170]OAQ72782.1 RTA1 domain-containing protein [Pochonia chlamydosporia 170]
MDGKYVDGSAWFYEPNKIAPIVFTVAFGISTILHFWQCIKYSSFKITALHPFACVLFTVGFALREVGAHHYKQTVPYIVSTILIYSAPPILELANFHVLGRILYYVPYHAPLHPGRTLTTFGSLSFVVEVLNGLGIAWVAQPTVKENLHNVGHGLLKASLLLQLFVIVLFLGTAGTFHYRCARGGVLTRATRFPLVTMYTSSLLVFVRCVYRTVEYFSSESMYGAKSVDELNALSPIIRYEWFFYVFEASLMLVNEGLWNVMHPRRFLPRDYHVYLAKDGKTELQGPGWEDERGFLMTMIDPLGCMDRGKKEAPFWETDGIGKPGN